MQLGHVFEALMLVCFGFSWPLNVIKAYKARTAKGTSLAFIILIITGYVAGISAKFINGQINYVLAVYFLNLAIVMSNVAVYIRNVELDKKNQGQVTKRKIMELKKKNQTEANYTYSQEENFNYVEMNKNARTNGVILMGGSFDKQIPVTELAESFEFNFDLYNRSQEKLSLANAKAYYEAAVTPLKPEAVILHLGDEDTEMFKTDSSMFDKAYMELLSTVSAGNKNMRIALVSINNPLKNETIEKMNAHIKALASAFRCTYINLDSAKLWNPKATKAATDFAYSMGLRARKPLMNVAEILYSYACLDAEEELIQESLVG